MCPIEINLKNVTTARYMGVFCSAKVSTKQNTGVYAQWTHKYLLTSGNHLV